MGGISRFSIFAVIFCLGCGALDESVKLQHQIGDGMQDSLDLQRQMGESLQQSLQKMDEMKSVTEQGMKDTATRLDQSLAKMDEMKTVTENGMKETSAKMEEMKAVTEKGMDASLKKMDEMRTVTEVGMKETSTKMDEMKSVTQKGMDASLAKMDQMRRDTNAGMAKSVDLQTQVLGKMKEQEKSVLIEQFQHLAAIVRDPSHYENLYRIGSAMITYQLLLDYKLNADWYSQFVVANFERCNLRATEVYGDLCTDTFAGEWVPLKGTPKGKSSPASEWLKALQKKIDHWMVTDGRRIANLPGISNLTKVKPLASNVIWILALSPQIVQKVFEFVISNGENVQQEVASDFLRMAVDKLQESLEVMAYEEGHGETLSSNVLGEFRRRKDLVEEILSLAGFRNREAGEQLRLATNTLVEAIGRRTTPLTELERNILRMIQGPKVE